MRVEIVLLLSFYLSPFTFLLIYVFCIYYVKYYTKFIIKCRLNSEKISVTCIA